MEAIPTIPALETRERRFLEDGHGWLFEAVRGEPFRFAIDETGMLHFGTRRQCGPGKELPPRFWRSATEIRDDINRDVLQSALGKDDDVTFIGIATCFAGIPYDWAGMPPFLGTTIWSSRADGWLPPDRTEQIFEAIGVRPLPPLDRELRLRDFSVPKTPPASAWYNGPAAGLLLRKKPDEWTRISFEGGSSPDVAGDPLGTSPEAIAAHPMIEALDPGSTASIDDRAEIVVAEAYRRYHHRIGIEPDAFRSAVASHLARTDT